MSFWKRITNREDEAPPTLPERLEAMGLDPDLVGFAHGQPDVHSAWHACPRLDWMVRWLAARGMARSVVLDALVRTLDEAVTSRPGLREETGALRELLARHRSSDDALDPLCDALRELPELAAPWKTVSELEQEEAAPPVLATWFETRGEPRADERLLGRWDESARELADAFRAALPWDVVAPCLLDSEAPASPYR